MAQCYKCGTFAPVAELRRVRKLGILEQFFGAGRYRCIDANDCYRREQMHMAPKSLMPNKYEVYTSWRLSDRAEGRG